MEDNHSKRVRGREGEKEREGEREREKGYKEGENIDKKKEKYEKK